MDWGSADGVDTGGDGTAAADASVVVELPVAAGDAADAYDVNAFELPYHGVTAVDHASAADVGINDVAAEQYQIDLRTDDDE